MSDAAISRSQLLSSIFRDPEHLSHTPLTIDNVMNYFYTSPFFDRSSNNGQLAMQGTGQGIQMSQKDMEDSLKRLTGIEFAIVHARPPGLFIIHKRYRKSPEEVSSITAYYVLNGNINQAPDLQELIGNRLISTISALRNSLSVARLAAMGGSTQISEGGPSVHRPGAAFNVRWGHGWRLNDSINQPEEEEEDEDDQEPEEKIQESLEVEENQDKIEPDQTKEEEGPQSIVERKGKGKRGREDDDDEVVETIANSDGKKQTAGVEKKRRTAR